MKLPSNIDASGFINAFQNSDYRIRRQTGNHVRLSKQQNGQQNITVPNHDPLTIGTLNAKLANVAHHLGVTK
jgi:predicted RNA binding protein YcfA (HicA-like mRNA interferase family)